jgi:hypothetical protein
MVCLNEKLPINLKQMKTVFISELDEIIEHKLYYLNDLDDIKKDKIKNSIIKDFRNKIYSDSFIYMIIDIIIVFINTIEVLMMESFVVRILQRMETRKYMFVGFIIKITCLKRKRKT